MEKEIEMVKKKVWSFGLSAKGVSDVPGLGYDILVEGKYQVKVVNKGDSTDAIGNKIIVAVVDGEEITYQVCKRGVCREETSPLRAFSDQVDTKN